MIQSLNENSLIQPFHIAMTRQHFEDFEKNAVSNFEEIEKKFMIKNEEAIRSQPISRKDRVN